MQSQNQSSNALLKDAVEAINSALLSGARSKRIEIVEKALELGADPNIADHFGMTPMHLAASANDVRMIKILMQKGARATDHGGVGFSPMACAAVSGRMDAVRMLAEHALDLESMQSNPQYGGRSLLEVCLIADKNECARWLIDHGADVESVDWRGESLIMRMLAAGRDDAALLLAQSGACVDDATMNLALQQSDTALVHELKLRHKPGRSVPRSTAQALAEDRWSEEDGPHPAEVSDALSLIMKAVGLKALHSFSSLRKWGASCLRASKITRSWSEIARKRRVTQEFFAHLNKGQALAAIGMVREFADLIDINARDSNGLSALQLLSRLASRTCEKTTGQEFSGALSFSNEQRTITELARAIESLMPDRSHVLCRSAETGNTVLHDLIENGHSHIVAFLLAQPEVTPSFKKMVNLSNHALHRPLHLCVQHSDATLIPALVKAGANLNAFDRRGHAPLHMASYMLEERCAETIINLGASIQVKTRDGQGIEDILIQRKGQSDVLQSLLQTTKIIASAKSIFSGNNPLSQAIKAGAAKQAKKTPMKESTGLKLVMPKRPPSGTGKPQDPS